MIPVYYPSQQFCGCSAVSQEENFEAIYTEYRATQPRVPARAPPRQQFFVMRKRGETSIRSSVYSSAVHYRSRSFFSESDEVHPLPPVRPPLPDHVLQRAPRGLSSRQATPHPDDEEEEQHNLLTPERSDSERSENPNKKFTEEDAVRTLYITGLPRDIKHREIRVLFRTIPEYEGVMISAPPPNKPDGHPIAFATFRTVAAAKSAMDEFNGFQLDQNINMYLRIEFAKANTRNPNDQRNNRQPDGSCGFSHSPTVSPFSQPGSPQEPVVPLLRPAHVYPAPDHYAPQMMPSVYPPVFCVYVTNIKPGVTQTELERALSIFPGIAIAGLSITESWLCLQSTSSQALMYAADCIDRKCIVNNVDVGDPPGLKVQEVFSS